MRRGLLAYRTAAFFSLFESESVSCIASHEFTMAGK